MKSEELKKLINKAKKFGSDFNGTLDSGLFDIPQNTIVITGESEEDGDYVREFCAENHIPESNIHYYDGEDPSNKAVAEFKAKMIKELEIDCFFENNPNEVYWMKQFWSVCPVHYINAKDYVIFSYEMIGLGYFIKLKQEGNNVVIAMLEPEDAGFTVKGEDEKELDKRRRSVGDGFVTKYPAKMVFKYLKGIKDKEGYFIDFDFNYGSNYAEELEKMGFKGIFPRKAGRELETNREKGQEVVKKNYKLLNIVEEKSFKKVEDALQFINEQENVYVVKANDPGINCFVPVSNSDEIDDYREEVTNYLEEQKSGLEGKGFMLQKKIEDCVESAPEVLYINGEPIYAVCCIENKFEQDGEKSKQSGCSQDLNFVLDFNSEMAKIGVRDYFPLAKKEKLNNYVDAGVLVDKEDGKPYFTEFCHSRKGYNAFYGELAMCPSVSQYFEAVMANTSPFDSIGAKRFAASISIFNSCTDDKRFVMPDLQMMVKGDNVWLVDAKKKDDKIVTAGYNVYTTAVVTGAGDTPEEAVKNCQKHLKEIKMKEMAHRMDTATNEDYGILSRYYYLRDNNLL